ncbi:type II toxin-antitoxin system VapC family toxin [Novosphingobium sp. Gsoil 351]|uniref:type II toxin-antitoxin system VapC family toxin n=1 Tax=Novosphingobium sp. Gsoil 351 TaxID=2675225 RepID=UPI0012B45C43|nr:type II toxin-antitoxin system VapC family toxin [Novosphingobium sp. Gsoil 351]QGN54685.1 PIN domain-containing protein [Novosphingobium sp. Gsoil 351]
MRAVDTNVLVRLLTHDDEAQTRIAKRIIAAGETFVLSTVLLETEWVLRGAYRFAQPDVNSALRALGGLRGVTFEAPDVIAQALDWHQEGMDFADAIHLASAGRCDAFVTFDRKFAKRAKTLAATPIKVL